MTQTEYANGFTFFQVVKATPRFSGALPVFGIILMNLLIPLAGIASTEPFWKVLVLNLSTWPLFMVVRVIYQSLIGMSSISLLVIVVIVATLTALTYKPLYKLMDRFTHTEPVLPSAGAVWLAIGLGVGLMAVDVVVNPAWFPQ